MDNSETFPWDLKSRGLCLPGMETKLGHSCKRINDKETSKSVCHLYLCSENWIHERFPQLPEKEKKEEADTHGFCLVLCGKWARSMPAIVMECLIAYYLGYCCHLLSINYALIVWHNSTCLVLTQVCRDEVVEVQWGDSSSQSQYLTKPQFELTCLTHTLCSIPWTNSHCYRFHPKKVRA